MKINLNNKHLLTFLLLLLLFIGFMFYLNISAIQHFFYINEIPGDIKHVIRTSSLVDLTTSFENSNDVYEYYIQHYARIDQYLEKQRREDLIIDVLSFFICSFVAVYGWRELLEKDDHDYIQEILRSSIYWLYNTYESLSLI